MSEDGTVALGSTSVSDDGLNVAYAISNAGSDWMTVKVRAIFFVYNVRVCVCRSACAIGNSLWMMVKVRLCV